MIDDYRAALAMAHELATDYLAQLPGRPVARPAAAVTIPGDLPAGPMPAPAVVAELAAAVEPGLVASSGGRYFGFVTGGTLPAAMAADWLTSAWDQNSALHVMSPAASAVQDVVGRWLLALLDLPRDAGVGFTTGAQMANWTCLAAARHHVLAAVGWDVEVGGLHGAPPVMIVVGEQRHSTIDRAVRFLGFGTGAMRIVAADDQGRMLPDALTAAVADHEGPLIVCLQAGEVNTGACDPFTELVPVARRVGAWIHVDGAFGLWARACADRRYLVQGVDAADSWSVDGHKWLNVPYDAGFAVTAHPRAHAAAMTQLAPYLIGGDDARHDAMNWSPEASRRARAFAAYAAIRSRGRDGLDELVNGHCRLARRIAERLRDADGVEVVNDVVLNQVLVRFGDDERTRAVIDAVQRDGTCWAGGTVFRDRAAMRIAVSGWVTSEEDADRSADAVLRAARLTMA